MEDIFMCVAVIFGSTLIVSMMGLLLALPFMVANLIRERHPEYPYWKCLWEAILQIGGDLE